MAMITRSIGTLLSAWLLTSISYAQQECMDDLRTAIRQMQDAVNNAPNKSLSARMEITSIGSEKGAQPNTLITDQYSSGDRLMLENEQFSHYEDAAVRVVVLNVPRTVLLYDQPKGLKTRQGDWQQFSDTLFKIGHIATCRRYHTPDGNRMDIKLTVPDHVKLSGISSISYTLDTDEHVMLTMLTKYRPGNMLSSYQLRYLHFRPGAASTKTARSPLEQIYAGQRLRPEFKGYRLKDNRKRAVHHGHVSHH